ncbi:variable surface protein [Plasmodium gonderi]|uniref:Variable surface protein n=1 Tax=Plasmodium gonderi TaxID=77519 RepID=A0A1Y1JNW9_PLAGO|nr:variable surface protein [Plasmodium gonderi]GAW84159.1 variable surface protein [Plasmodium gonderi]
MEHVDVILNCVIYEFVKNFSTYKEHIDYAFGSIEEKQLCPSNSLYSSLQTNVTYNDMESCSKCFSYIPYVDLRYKTVEKIKGPCLFLYYWIYKHLKKQSKEDKTKQLYDITIEKALKTDGPLWDTCKKYNLNNDYMKNLDITYCLYKLVNNKEDLDLTCEEPQFYESLKNITKICDQDVRTESLNNIECDKNAICQNNISFFIVITVVTMLIIFTLFVILYKFLPYNSWIHRRIKEKINKWKNMDEEFNMFQSSESYNSISSDKIYNVLYQYD